jgi:serine/threonine protein kinase
MPELVRTVGRYGIVRELGRGGMAVVHLARQQDLDRLVALKELAAFHAADPSFAQRFVRESRLAGSLVHPNVITVFDYFEHAGTPFIAMEYVERGSLRPYVGRMTLAQIGGVLEGLLAGLAEAEQHSIVHRDLKPENMMVTAAGGVKIADFGIAKATQAADTGAFVTATGTTVGTPPYMAPEQAMGKGKEVGPWTDLYSVGCMAYELFTGKPPFYDADEPLAILLRHITEALPPASEVADVDPGISAWIDHLTVKDPKGRPESATAAWEELEELLIGKLGPRWRREARLPDPPSPVPGPATPPPSEPMQTPEGIDVEGTGPDTPEALPATEAPPTDDSGYETYLPPPTGPPPIEGIDLEGTGPDTPETLPAPEPEPEPELAETYISPPAGLPAAESAPEPQEQPQQPPPAAAEPPPAAPAPRRVVLLARAGAIALLAALLIPLLADAPDRWNAFAVLSPFEALGVAAAMWVLAGALGAGRASAEIAAGALVAFGALTLIAALALIRFTADRLDAVSTLLAVVVLLGAVAGLAAGVRCLRSAEPGAPAAGADPAALVLGLAGTALACVALFVDYDGFSSLWDELLERESAEFFFEPAIAAAAMLAGLALLGARPRLASGLLLAVGAATALHHAGLIVAAWRAIGEVGETRAAGYIGVLGGLLVVAAGASVRRATRTPAASGEGGIRTLGRG